MLQCGRPPPPEGAETCGAGAAGADDPREEPPPPPPENTVPPPRVPPPPLEERGAGGVAIERGGGAEARAEDGATGTRMLVPRGGVFLPPSIFRSFFTAPGIFLSGSTAVLPPAVGGAEFVFTKRCSPGSYTIEELAPCETMRAPPLPSRIVRDVRTGGVVATRPLLSASRGGDFKVSHF